MTQSGVTSNRGVHESEQARGKLSTSVPISGPRCGLYRCSRAIAFPGETLSDTIVAILDRAPDWSRYRPDATGGVTVLRGA